MQQGIRRRDGNSSEAIAAILNPHEGYREKLIKRGITPRDFERENKLRIKQMQRQNREQREREEAAQRFEAFKLTRFKGVRPRVFSHPDNAPTRHAFLQRNAAASDLRNRHNRHAFKQHQEPLESPLPPAFTRPVPPPTLPPPKEPVPSLDELEARSRDLVAKMSLKDKTDYVNANAWDVIRKSPPASSASSCASVAGSFDAVAPTNPRPPLATTAAGANRNFGRIPLYLLARKEQWAAEEAERRLNAPDPDCPPGMVRLDDDERLRTLHVLQTSLDAARVEMNRLPLRIETQRQIRYKTALEHKLQEIEDAIVVFKKPKVFVAAPFASESDVVSDKTSTSPVKAKAIGGGDNRRMKDRIGAAA